MPEQNITSLLFIASTAAYEGPNNTFFELTIPQVFGAELPIPAKLGAKSVWQLDANPGNLMTARQIASELITLTNDNPFIEEPYRWQPASFFLIGKGDSGFYEVICAIPDWQGDALGTADGSGISEVIELSAHNQQLFP